MQNDQLYIIKNKSRLRCAICKKDFKPFSESRFAMLRISYAKWLMLIKLFELSVSARVATKKSELDYVATLKPFDIFRQSILNNLNDEY